MSYIDDIKNETIILEKNNSKLMTGLEAFEDIKIVMTQLFGGFEKCNKELDIIEKELKEKQKFDEFMKKYNLNDITELDDFFNQYLNKEIERCSKCKELRALEIIKAIRPFIVYESIDGKYHLETIVDNVGLTKEDYDLLKEV